ncbi:CAP domain-containing protein [Xylanimonas allomyrinae]|uniref:CAP domain-containing protein n=1 Tax=Xylanimonas allomyrinae TaxID=2509459 RepID=A0A4P6EL21_9MICO|nr:CAP domain-containing protein [Xylanimonas allomyrinae]QAY63352.1 CAP domain-containing protein [Xylanimonas allomyrinae]
MPGPRAFWAGALVPTAALVALCGACAPAPAPATAPPTPADPVAYASALVQATNEARAAERLPALRTSSCATDQARQRLGPLLGGRKLTHASLVPVTHACAPPSGMSAENLSRAAASPGAVVDAWLASPGHRANLLDPDLTEVGVACTADGDRADAPMLCSQVFLG